MNTETLKIEEMASLKKLADLNLAISEANSKLKDIKDSEIKYLKLREETVEKEIEEIFKSSAELLDKTHHNYEGIHTFCNIVSSYKDFLDENYTQFQEMLAEFEERNKEWRKRYEEQVGELGRQEKIIEKDRQEIESGKKEIEKIKIQLQKDKILLEDRRQTLQRSIERLKNKQK